MTAQIQPPRPPATYWWCQAGGWGFFFLVNLFTSQGFIGLSWQLASGYLILSLGGILLTHVLRAWLLRHAWLELPIPRLILRVVFANLLLALLLVAVVTLYYWAVPPPGSSFGSQGRMAVIATWFVFVFNDFIILTFWSGIYFGFAYFKRQRRVEIERYQAQTALAEAELRGLRSQLNPHFFFNSLNSLRALITEDPARAQDAITQLAAILRYHLQSGERSLVPLGEELETVEQYLALELIRFEDRLTIERAIGAEALPCLVPPLALQTLVENAIKYGVSRDAGAGVIRLTARRRGTHNERGAAKSKAPLGLTEGSVLEISIRNTGSLHSATAGSSTGLGLANLRTRLRLLFGDRASLELHERGAGLGGSAPGPSGRNSARGSEPHRRHELPLVPDRVAGTPRMKALLIDDERLARSEMRRLLLAHPEIEIVGEAANATQAEEKISSLKPDLIFLDVQMPGRTGFELLAELADAPRVIFTTAYDQYALKAFDFGALDYLLKPIEPARLARALARLDEPNEQRTEPASLGQLDENDQVFLKDGERCWLVRVGDIRLLESEGNYARVYFGANRPLIPRTLQALESRLDPAHFFRVSRQHLINLRFVTKVEPWFDGGLLLRLGDGDPEVKVARRRAQDLRERLSL